jgi:hypothetical protein
VDCASPADVADVWVDGRRRVAAGRLVGYNLAELVVDASRPLAAELVTRAGLDGFSHLARRSELAMARARRSLLAALHGVLAARLGGGRAAARLDAPAQPLLQQPCHRPSRAATSMALPPPVPPDPNTDSRWTSSSGQAAQNATAASQSATCAAGSTTVASPSEAPKPR